MKTKLTLALALAAAPFANAALINVNFNGFTGAADAGQVESSLEGPGGGLGTSWNQFADEDSAGTLVTSTGAATTIEFTSNFSESRYNGDGPSLTMLRAALTDFGRGATRNLTITGLELGGIYDIWLVGYRDSTAARERIVGNWATTNATTSSTDQLIDNRVGNNGATFVDGYNYVLFENVVADGAGQIVFDGKGATILDGFDDDYRHGLNGFQINAIPEPSSLALLGLGGLMVLRRRR